MSDLPAIPQTYLEFLTELKARIGRAQVRAALAVSHELIQLYWEIGRDLETVIINRDWGAKVVDQVAHDLKVSFPGIEGFSRANLYRMRAFYLAYTDPHQIVAQAVRQLPWGQNVIIFERIKDPTERLWYAQKVLEEGWTRSVLAMQISSKAYERQGKAISNFQATLPPPQSDLAQQITKDPYSFGFLTLGKDAREREIEKGLLEHLKAFLLELGTGFAFVGSQYELEVEGESLYIDCLMYHLKLRCFVVIELKARDFEPEDAGQMQFYLGAVDAQMRHPSDNKSIGIILCQGKSRLKVEYTLNNSVAPIGVSEYQFTQALPEELQTELPTVEMIEAELEQWEEKG